MTEPHLGDLFCRVCPKCGQMWTSRKDWDADTKLAGQETRDGSEQRPNGDRAEYKIRVTTFEHVDCGGQMFGPGAVIWSRTLTTKRAQAFGSVEERMRVK